VFGQSICQFSILNFRAKKGLVRHILAVWTNYRHRCDENTKDARTGVCHLQRDQQCNCSAALHARIPILRQTHGKTEMMQVNENIFENDSLQRIQFSKTDSDLIAKVKGTFVERPKQATGAKKTGDTLPGESRKERKRRQLLEKAKLSGQPGAQATPQGAGGDNTPNKILFCTNLPEETTDQMLAMLFQQCVCMLGWCETSQYSLSQVHRVPRDSPGAGPARHRVRRVRNGGPGVDGQGCAAELQDNAQSPHENFVCKEIGDVVLFILFWSMMKHSIGSNLFCFGFL